MEPTYENLDLFDLINERYELLRSIFEQAGNEQKEMHISQSEWTIMAIIYNNEPTIAYVTKHVDISRQAIHKCIKSLAIKGLVVVKNAAHSRKHKCIRLTEFGERCYEQNKLQKALLEKQIAATIGNERLSQLKNLLKSDWGIKAVDANEEEAYSGSL